MPLIFSVFVFVVNSSVSFPWSFLLRPPSLPITLRAHVRTSPTSKIKFGHRRDLQDPGEDNEEDEDDEEPEAPADESGAPSSSDAPPKLLAVGMTCRIICRIIVSSKRCGIGMMNIDGNQAKIEKLTPKTADVTVLSGEQQGQTKRVPRAFLHELSGEKKRLDLSGSVLSVEHDPQFRVL